MVRYGLNWDESHDGLSIEFEFIRAGGHIEIKGKQYGNGLLAHFLAARKEAWPHRYEHRWTRLMYEEFIKNDITILMGSASAQKTSHVVEFCLLNYWARPDNTLVILSTVNMDKLDIGCYAELTMLWKAGQDLHPWLAGKILSHKRAITTDVLEEEGIRDFRKGVICRPCMVPGTLVDTPIGPRAIETIRPGDIVLNAVGAGKVRATSLTWTQSLVRVNLCDGRTVDCTPEHPFLTLSGWKNAVDLTISDRVLSADETLFALRQKPCGDVSKPKVLLPGMCSDYRRMQAMWETCEARKPRQEQRRVLQLSVRDALAKASSSTGVVSNQSVPDLWKADAEVAYKPVLLFDQVPGSHGTDPVFAMSGLVSTPQAEVPPDSFLQLLLRHEMDYKQTMEGPTQKSFSYQSGDVCLESVPRFGGLELSDSVGSTQIGWPNKLVQSGYSFSRNKARSGIGRMVPPSSERQEARSKQGCSITGTRVDGVEILEPRSLEGYCESQGGYPVHNLEVAGHPSYSVNGVIVHNCYVGGKFVGLGVLAGVKQDYIFYFCDELQFMQEAFSGSWPHLFSNGQTKIIGSGNPKHDPDDELSKTGEPKGGWAGHPEPQKTEVWDTKFMGGRCINLVGTDSPNFDFPASEPQHYKGLIGWKFAERIATDYGMDSFDYYRLIKGVMKMGFAQSRVITRQLCRDHHASEKAEWINTTRKRIYWLDPSYGGEDQCAGGCLEWGEGLNGETLIRLVGYRLYRFNLNSEREVENQIADILAEELEAYNIPSVDVFYDATGKGTLGGAFALKFGLLAPVAVSSGGKPTTRPVRKGVKVEDKDGKWRLKRCDEEYYDFITEMWMSVRACIEANQMRELPGDFITEGCARIYTMEKGKIAVESKTDPKKKEDLKRRLGHSPNLFDGLAIGIEGARQRGFVIAQLGPTGAETSAAATDWLRKKAQKHLELVRSKQVLIQA